MIFTCLLFAYDLYRKMWLFLGRRACGMHATAHTMTLGPSDLDLLKIHDFLPDLDLTLN